MGPLLLTRRQSLKCRVYLCIPFLMLFIHFCLDIIWQSISFKFQKPCYKWVVMLLVFFDKLEINARLKILHCSAVITRSSGAMNTDRVIRGPRYTWSALYGTWQPHPLAPLQFPPVIMGYYTLHVCYIVCSFFIYLFIFYFFFIVETLCMYLAWFPFYSFNPVNNKFFKLKLFCFLLWSSRELTATVLHYE